MKPAAAAPPVELPGSVRPVRPGAQGRQAVPATTAVAATVVLRRRAALPEQPVLLTPDELAEGHGADPADVELVVTTLTGLGVSVDDVDAAARLLRVSGPSDAVSAVFGTSLVQVGEGRGRSGSLSLPGELDGIVTAVLGLDDRPQARARFRPAAGTVAGYTPPELGRVYRFPADTDGTGQTVAIIELGGGFGQADLDAYFGGLGIAVPTVTAVEVDGAKNLVGKDPQGADGEVLLDVEVVGALAPGATVLVYFAPNTDAGFLNAVSAAAHATPTPAAMSISWGAGEDDWTPQARTALDEAMADASALGVTVTAAAGDDGSTDRATDGKSHCDFPASSPHALACGGTRLEADLRPVPGPVTVTSEVVWNNGTGKGATGGGVSSVFPRPAWQARAGVPDSGRGVPDVAGVADPQTGYRVRIDGRDAVIGGTSAVAPLWAALVARLVQATGTPLGLVAPALYGTVQAGGVAPGFRDIVEGDNGAFRAAVGWDACTGLGVPDGETLLAALRPTAG